MDKNTVILADALSKGTGGKITIWSDQKTIFKGIVSTKGGSQSGDGGFVEVSGKQQLIFAGQVDTGATHGKLGTLLLDPTDIYIAPDDGDKDTYDVSDLVQTQGNVILSATNNVIIADNAYFVASIGTITLQADADLDGVGSVILNGTLSTGGRNIDISGANVNTSQIYSDSNTRSGFIKVTATNSTVTGDLISGSNGIGGSITVNSLGGSVTTRDIATSSTNRAGAIDIRANTSIQVGSVYSTSISSNGGTVFIQANDTITAGSIISSSTIGNAANVTLTSQNGNIDLRGNYISATSEQGNGAKVEVHAYGGSITDIGVLTTTTSGNGGRIILDALNDITGGGIVSNSFAKTAGNIDVTSTAGSINFGKNGVGANSKRGNAGKITLTAKSTTDNRTITTGLIDAGADGDGNGGTVTLTASGDINTSTIVTNSNGIGRSGNITLTSTAGKIDVTNDSPDTPQRVIFAGANGGNAGAVTLNAFGDIVTRTIFAGSNTGAGNTVRLTSQSGGIDTGDGYITTATNGGNGGNVILTAVKDIKVGSNIDANSTLSGKGGGITLTSSEGGITAQNVNTYSYAGAGGNVRFNAQLGIKVGNIDASANDNGNAGSVTLLAGDDIEALAIKANVSGNGTGIGNGGVVKLISQRGDVLTEYVRTDSAGAKGGNITLDSAKSVRATGSFTFEDISYSIFADGLTGNSSVNISYDKATLGQTIANFNVGDASINGTFGAIANNNYIFLPPSSQIVLPDSLNLGKLKILDNQSTITQLPDFYKPLQDLGNAVGNLTGNNDRNATIVLTPIAALNDDYQVPFDQIEVASKAWNAIFLILQSCRKFGVTDRAQIAYVLATAGYESRFGANNLTSYPGHNNLYEYPHGISLGQSPQDFFNNAYHDYLGNGAPSSGDVYRYRGRGYAQLTWKDNYQRFSNLFNVDLGHL
ncbi:hypothetical protein V2H45_14250 [Tumidithrix elongata RA019]|uniref:Uncharacterized protein n=1 Tax=Tumidithrix elongata BACA0141 TaxID=2716417 RepID=A0AAW9Q226_9CYAN|nr:hypothetical protein [Tumidithrix elongata RA019]